jgi:replicative DNA helicase
MMLDGFNDASASDVTLERALLALCFSDSGNLDRLGRLVPDDLTDHVLASVLAAALDVHSAGEPVNLVTLRPRLQGIIVDESITALDVVRTLSIGAVPPDVSDITRRLRSLAEKRRLAETLRSLADAVVEDGQTVSGIAADAISHLNDLTAESNESVCEPHIYEAAREFIERLQSDDDPIEIPTGFRDLDAQTGGWHRGQFILLGGRTSMGKTATALGSMLRTAQKGYGVLYFSLEMTRDQLVARALADYAYTNPAIAYADLRPGKVSDPQQRRLSEAAERFRNMPIVIDTRSGLTVGDILARARKERENFKAKGHRLSLIVVDHLLKIKPSSRYAGQPVKEIDEISQAMCVMAKSLDVAVMGLQQLNRQVESRDNPRPLLSDLKGSGTLEQDADVILFAHRPAYQFERLMQEPDKRAEAEAAAEALKHDLELQIAKQRNGPTTTLQLWCDMSANAIRDKSWRR